jgi:hypothetical protein
MISLRIFRGLLLVCDCFRVQIPTPRECIYSFLDGAEFFVTYSPRETDLADVLGRALEKQRKSK